MEFSMQLSVLFSSKHCLWLDLPPSLLPFYIILAGSAGGKAPSPLQLHHVQNSLCVCLLGCLWAKGENSGGSSAVPALDVPVPRCSCRTAFRTRYSVCHEPGCTLRATPPCWLQSRLAVLHDFPGLWARLCSPAEPWLPGLCWVWAGLIKADSRMLVRTQPS